MAKYNPQTHSRRLIRLKEYDYSQAGAYFVTIVTWHRVFLLGEIQNKKMKINSYGEIVQKWWHEIPNHFANVETGAFVVMPNHIHGIILIFERRGTVPVPEEKNTQNSPRNKKAIIAPNEMGEETSGGEIPRGTTSGGIIPRGTTSGGITPRGTTSGGITPRGTTSGGITPPLPTLGQIVAYFKYQSTKEMNALGNTGTITKFWQRNYYEHIIRDERDMHNKTEYIEANPMLWDEDGENPINKK